MGRPLHAALWLRVYDAVSAAASEREGCRVNSREVLQSGSNSIALARGENELAAGGIFFWFLNYLAVCFI
jgi:hypothetical protein